MAATLSTTTPVYLRAKQSLQRDIDRRYKGGQRLPTVDQLAKRYDVGRVSMHRAVRELADEGVLIARPRAGIQVADRHTADHAAPPLAAAVAGRTISVITTQAARMDGMHRRMLEGVRQWLGRYDCTVRHRDALTGDPRQSFADDDADALIFINASKTELIAAPRHAVVNIETGPIDQFAPDQVIDHVTVNQLHGAAIAGHTLRTAGATSVCYLGAHSKRQPAGEPLTYDAISTLRLQGFESGWGAPVPKSHQLLTDFYDESAGAEVVGDYLALRPRPEAIVATTDELAVGFVHGAMAHGMLPGIHYRIIGFDGQQRALDMRWGPLTTVEVPAREMGCKAAELLVERFQRRDRPSQTVALGCKLLNGVTHVLGINP